MDERHPDRPDELRRVLQLSTARLPQPLTMTDPRHQVRRQVCPYCRTVFLMADSDSVPEAHVHGRCLQRHDQAPAG